jgi:hypothetical protein
MNIQGYEEEVERTTPHPHTPRVSVKITRLKKSTRIKIKLCTILNVAKIMRSQTEYQNNWSYTMPGVRKPGVGKS